MELHAILRRDGWRAGEALEQLAARSTKVGIEQIADDVRWIRSYVLEECDGSLGTICIYQATSSEAIWKRVGSPTCRSMRSSGSGT